MPPAVRAPSPTVTLKPEWANWSAALAKKDNSPARAELGLDTDHPIVFSGHQPIVFHNGILAKFIAQHQAALRAGATRVWIIADQDPVNPAQIRVPNGIGAALRADAIDLIPPSKFPPGVASASIPARFIFDVDKVDDRLAGFVKTLNLGLGDLEPGEPGEMIAREQSIADQFARCTIQHACERLRVSIPKLIFASELLGSDTLWGVVESMLADPRACVEAYNRAVARYPQARVRELAIEGDRVELPLWGLRKMRARVAINTGNIDQFTREELAPRGLFMSLLVRAHLGELFIHGAGGWRYDQVTQDWAREWLGVELAPMALATATQRLDLGFAPEQIVDPARAMWETHHARHNPAAVGDHETQRKKDMCLRRIVAMQEHNEDPSAMYFKMHALLEEYRAQYADTLAGFQERVRVAKAMRKQIELAADRTWPFVLFDESALHRLGDEVAAQML